MKRQEKTVPFLVFFGRRINRSFEKMKLFKLTEAKVQNDTHTRLASYGKIVYTKYCKQTIYISVFIFLKKYGDSIL
jgi:hypothetical protein